MAGDHQSGYSLTIIGKFLGGETPARLIHHRDCVFAHGYGRFEFISVKEATEIDQPQFDADMGKSCVLFPRLRSGGNLGLVRP